MDEVGLMFGLVRAALERRQADGMEAVEASGWWRLFRLAQQNHVAALVADALPAGVPRDVLMPWLAEREKVAARHRYQRQVQQQVEEVMQQHGITTLVLKGTHTAQYYPQPELRDFGDIDLYFFNRHDEADTVVAHELHVAVDRHAHHHTRYDLRGVTVESHFDFVNRHYPPSNRRYEEMLKTLAPSATFEVLFLLRHMAGHFSASRIALRDVVDWALTCRALEREVDWKTVGDMIGEYGMVNFAAVLNCIAAERLGIKVPLQKSNVEVSAVERDIVLGSDAVLETGIDGLPRLGWKLRRWRALAWKRKMVYNDNQTLLLMASMTAHTMKPQSILHKM